MNIKQVGGEHTNTSSRNGEKVLAIVDHISDGTIGSLTSWFNTVSNTGSSAHFAIPRTGSTILQFVDTDRAAWHAGIKFSAYPKDQCKSELVRDKYGVSVNSYTVGIEHEGYKGNGVDGTLTSSQYDLTVQLHRFLIEKYNIKIDRKHILGHYEIDPIRKAYCPGKNFPWTNLMSDLLLWQMVKNGSGWDAVIMGASAQSMDWIESIDTAMKMAEAKGNIGAMEILIYLPRLIEKVYLMKYDLTGKNFNEIMDKVSSNVTDWNVAIANLENLSNSGQLGIFKHLRTLIEKIVN